MLVLALPKTRGTLLAKSNQEASMGLHHAWSESLYNQEPIILHLHLHFASEPCIPFLENLLLASKFDGRMGAWAS